MPCETPKMKGASGEIRIYIYGKTYAICIALGRIMCKFPFCRELGIRRRMETELPA